LLLMFVVVIAAVTATLDITVTRSWERSLRDQVQLSLTEKTRMFAERVANDRQHPLQQIVREEAKAANARATVIDRSGKVLAESEANPETMENHATRPEFAEALQHGRVGSSVRSSSTIGVPFLYVAVPLEQPSGAADGEPAAVRLAYPLAALHRTTAGVRHTLLWTSGLAVLVAVALSLIAAQSVSRRLRRIVDFAARIASGDLTARIAEDSSDEIGRVAAALDSTAHQLEHSFRGIRTGQQQLETLLNSMQEAVIAISADGKVQWANRVMARLTASGVRLGAPVVETVRDPDFLRAITEAIHSGSVRTTRATSILPGRFYNVTAAPMPGAGAVAVLYDVSEIERVEKTRRDFVANVSHELRTPLTSIQGYAETLLESAPTEGPDRQFLEIIRKNAVRMATLSEDLLTLAGVESGEVAFRFRQVAPAEMLEDVAKSFREISRSQRVELVVEAPTERAVEADTDAVHQVLANLVDNALKYAAAGGKIVLGARDAGAAVEFYVRDFGPGIASEHLPRLFERFYRVDKARSRESGGTGLGLAIAKHIVRAHGGAIRAESVLGHGSTFLFTLPAAAVAGQA
jgi:two-component system, OmpR family, phosphate regulon sensor histidine kinase PhoR